jgi:hypothetical protein
VLWAWGMADSDRPPSPRGRGRRAFFRYKTGKEGLVEVVDNYTAGTLVRVGAAAGGTPITTAIPQSGLASLEFFTGRGEGGRDSLLFVKGGVVKVYRNDYGDGSLVATSIDWPIPPDVDGWPVYVGDSDGDGRDDLLFLKGKQARVAKRIPAGTFGVLGPLASLPPPCSNTPFDFVDVTGDQRADLVCVSPSNLYVSPAQPDGSFGVALVSTFDISERVWDQAPALIDIDGDGVRDFTSVLDGKVWYRQNKGNGVFGSIRRLDLDLGAISSNTFGSKISFAWVDKGASRPSLVYVGDAGTGPAIVSFAPIGKLR